ncbi:1-acyl-sn-glycerol-3-phosphate acyltransferase [Marinithermofilum abyssi]|uniref:1-acyl-sn-glycerol-3-phosphate acyltransferase n=1 Tax=Marinithermofilum abyssi TaxID=1571185 RepID=A0A8J2VCM5_9BACL|nr:lysophospholipid acyltransferase family protein [Marinithermofilum abyssi]GGE11179.1 1-acyl-sn-glycerol-3-phosphate acyltransferase [Marinithermofilum abyssi]
MLYRTFRLFFRIIFTFFFRWEIKGAQHVPKQGPVLLCANHISNWDPPLVGSSLRRKVHFMAKEELFHIPLLSFLIRNFGAFPVKRGSGDKRALRTALDLLAEQKVLGVFPEGTRSKTGELGKAHTGATYMALKSKAPIVPVAIIGPYRLFRKIQIVFGPPISMEPYLKEKITSDTIQQVTDRVMGDIASMIAAERK